MRARRYRSRWHEQNQENNENKCHEQRCKSHSSSHPTIFGSNRAETCGRFLVPMNAPHPSACGECCGQDHSLDPPWPNHEYKKQNNCGRCHATGEAPDPIGTVIGKAPALAANGGPSTGIITARRHEDPWLFAVRTCFEVVHPKLVFFTSPASQLPPTARLAASSPPAPRAADSSQREGPHRSRTALPFRAGRRSCI
jgi:hypothetical protein